MPKDRGVIIHEGEEFEEKEGIRKKHS